MLETLIEKLSSFPPELATLVLAMLPVSELRGAIPVGVLLFKLNFIKVLGISILGNLIPVLPILLFFDKVENLLKASKLSNRLLNWFLHRVEKRSTLARKYGPLGLMFFVAVPLPVTGAWTGSAVAFALGLDVRKSFLYIMLGVFLASIVVSLLTYFGVVLVEGIQ